MKIVFTILALFFFFEAKPFGNPKNAISCHSRISNAYFGLKDSVPEKKSYKLDSNYVVGYSHKLVVGLYQSWRSYDLLFDQRFISDTAGESPFNYIARGNNSTGISFAYDKISFALSSSVKATESDLIRKGISKTSNLSFSINSKRYRLEAAYRKYTGFYDNYTGRRDTNFVNDSIYYQIPDMYSKAFRLKGFYFFNKKQRFSYGAAFNNTARQLKTAGSFVLVSNLYSFRVASDSSFIPPGAGIYYPQWEQWNNFKILGISGNLGYSCNIVLFKRLFANLTGTLGLELQQRNYSTADGVSNITDWNFNWSSGDLRGSLGYNGERIFIMLTYLGDFSVYRLQNEKLGMNSRMHAGSFSFGYRFNKKDKKFMTWLKNNKIYRML